jgi:hypothetical protein
VSETDPSWTCGFCRDTGKIYCAEYEPHFRFCGCPAGRPVFEAEPDWAEQANAAEKFLLPKGL